MTDLFRRATWRIDHVDTRHAIFYVTRSTFAFLSLPDGHSLQVRADQGKLELHAGSEGQAVLREWWDKHERQRAIESQPSHLSNPLCGQGYGTPPQVKGRGSDWLSPPRLSEEDRAGIAFAAWIKTVKREQTVRTWVGGFVEDGVESTVDLGQPTQWASGIPAKEITLHLNRLARNAWRIIHVSEDRGIYVGRDANNDSAPTTIRYLLQRTVRASGPTPFPAGSGTT
jgi:hypothetical protein